MSKLNKSDVNTIKQLQNANCLNKNCDHEKCGENSLLKNKEN